MVVYGRQYVIWRGMHVCSALFVAIAADCGLGVCGFPCRRRHRR